MTNFEQIISEQEGRPILGMAVHRYNPDFLEMMAMFGFKAVWIEMEHGLLRFDQAADLCRIASGLGLLSMIRIPVARRDTVSYASECGPDMIDVPMVESAQTARDLVHFAKYPPQGRRGFYCSSRAEGFAINESLQDIPQRVNSELALAVQIESQAGFEHVEEICSVPGIDAIFVGRGDLSLDLGVPGEIDHPEVSRITEEIMRIAKLNGKRIIIPGSPNSAAHWKAKGADLLFLASDTSCMTAGLRGNLDAVMQSYEQAASNHNHPGK
ncbi:MAG: hypothetical protein JXM70_10650 [Pirellulales bacterium]|nr:hypothetical protein [Pirellulales bacterium]